MSVTRRSHAERHVERGAPAHGRCRTCTQPLGGTRPRRAASAALGAVWNGREGRLRAGWRLLGFLVLLLLVAVAEGRLRVVLEGRLPDLYDAVIRALAFALLVTAALLLAGRVFDRRPVTDFGLHLSRRWWAELGLGLGLGALLMFAMVALELVMGWVKITDTLVSASGQPFAATVVLGIVAVAAVAFGEEASYRGYPIKNFIEGLGDSGWGVVAAVSIPALFFGMAHVTNPGATWLSTANTVIVGLLFGTAYVLTGELALPIGLHFAWDYVQAFVFGVVGNGSHYGSVLALSASSGGGARWTGLPYGVEAGVLGTAAMTIGFLLMVAWRRIRRGAMLRVTPGT
jgi:membrane protease YdiL (CAAX protease family)